PVMGVSSVLDVTDNAYSVATNAWGLKLSLNAEMPIDGGFIVEATAKVSNGISNYSGRYRSIFTGALVATATEIGPTPATLGAAYKAAFGEPTLGANIGFRVRVVNKNGETSPWFY